MTRDEAKHLVMMVSAAYPNWKPMDLRGTVDTWAVMLQEYEYQSCVVALKTYILTDTAGFAAEHWPAGGKTPAGNET